MSAATTSPAEPRRAARRPSLALTVAAVAAAAMGAPGAAGANGRSPNSTAVHFVPEDERTILMPVTFGLMVSRDDGESFSWVCEAAMGYSGTFDPEYAVFPDGTIFLSTQSNVGDASMATAGDLRRSRDGGCTFETVTPGAFGEYPGIFEVELGPDGRLWVGTRTSGEPNDVWVSDDQGETFVSANLAEDAVWWYTLRTTPADPDRLYVTGFRPVDSEAGTPPAAVLRRSDDGGQTWSDLPVDGFEFGDEIILYLLGVSPVDPDVVFARTVRSIDENKSDILYRSGDGGASWTEMARYANDPLSAFWISPDGQRVVAGAPFPCPGDPLVEGGAAPNGCVRISEDGGLTWRRASQEPRLGCIGQRSDGTLFGCTNRTIDGYSLGRSTDGDTWEPIYRFQDTAGPLECAADTAQAECAETVFPQICQGTGMCAAADAGPGPGPGDDDGGDGGGGCCKVGGSPTVDAGWLAALALALALLRRRR